jgi:predicted CopG family antitoxin
LSIRLAKNVITTIQLTAETSEKLEELRKKGETYEDVILRLIRELRAINTTKSHICLMCSVN